MSGSTSPTISDVALFSYIACAPEGHVDLAPFSNVAAWVKRIEDMPGFETFVQASVGRTAI